MLAVFPEEVADYFQRAARWVRLMPYRQMLAAIYRQYPDMAVNSVVRHLGLERPTRRQSPFTRGMTSAFDITGTMHRSPDRRLVWNPKPRQSEIRGAPSATTSKTRWSSSARLSDSGEQESSQAEACRKTAWPGQAHGTDASRARYGARGLVRRCCGGCCCTCRIRRETRPGHTQTEHRVLHRPGASPRVLPSLRRHVARRGASYPHKALHLSWWVVSGGKLDHRVGWEAVASEAG